MSAPFRTIVTTSRWVAETGRRLEETRLLAACLQEVGANEIGVAVAWLAGELPQGRPGLVRALLD